MKQIPSPLDALEYLVGTPEKERWFARIAVFYVMVVGLSMLLYPWKVYEQRARYANAIVQACETRSGPGPRTAPDAERFEWFENCIKEMLSE